MGKKILVGIYRYLLFFLVVAFVVTCCMVLFITTLSDTLQLSLTQESLNMAAKLTFGNVILLSVLFTVIDKLRRQLTTEKVTRLIADAMNRVVQGDFSVQITPISRFATDDKLNEIIACLNTMTRELAGVETLRTDFVANVSHELKTPLAAMQNYAVLLQTPHLPEVQRMEYAKGIAEETRRLADMMTNVLRLNRLEKQQIYPTCEEYDLTEQVCACLLQYEAVWEEKEIELETQMEEAVMVTTDKELLALVWNNLFSNAFKFTPRKGRVSVVVQAEAREVRVMVKDTGCGMTKEVGERIFEKFYQGDASHQTQGNGLGLALVKRVMDILHGEIHVESKAGEGSVFTVVVQR